MQDKDIVVALTESVKGMLLMSESEFPLDPFLWSASEVGGPLDGVTLLKFRNYPQGTAVEQMNPNAFFGGLTLVEEGLDEEQLKSAGQFRELYKQMNAMLKDLKVFRVGKIRIDVYIVGATPEGNWAGVSSVLIET